MFSMKNKLFSASSPIPSYFLIYKYVGMCQYFFDIATSIYAAIRLGSNQIIHEIKFRKIYCAESVKFNFKYRFRRFRIEFADDSASSEQRLDRNQTWVMKFSEETEKLVLANNF